MTAKTNLGSHPVGESIPIKSRLYNPADDAYDAISVIIDLGIIGGDASVVSGEAMSRIELGVYTYTVTPTATGVYNGVITATTVDGYVKVDEIEFTVYKAKLG